MPLRETSRIRGAEVDEAALDAERDRVIANIRTRFHAARAMGAPFTEDDIVWAGCERRTDSKVTPQNGAAVGPGEDSPGPSATTGSTAGAGGQGAPVDGDSAAPAPAPEVDWARFVPTAPLPSRLGQENPRRGDIFASWSPYAEHGSVRECVDFDERDIVLAGTYRWHADLVRLVRHADGRWADGYNPSGPCKSYCGKEHWVGHDETDGDPSARLIACCWCCTPFCGQRALAKGKGSSTPPRSSRSGDPVNSGSTPENAPGGEKDAAGPAERGAEQSDAGGPPLPIIHGNPCLGCGAPGTRDKTDWCLRCGLGWDACGKAVDGGVCNRVDIHLGECQRYAPFEPEYQAALRAHQTSDGGLLPCPFCGGTVRVSCVDFGEDGARFECDPCGAMGPWAGDGEEEARRLWNLRARTAGGTP